LLSWLGHKVAASRCGKAERNRPDSLTSGALCLKRYLRARSNERALVLSGSIEYVAQELVRISVAVGGTICRDHSRAAPLNGTLDGRGHRDIAREAVALRHDEQASTGLLEFAERCNQGGSVLEFSTAADAKVGVPPE
jgi:hypothetical protein